MVDIKNLQRMVNIFKDQVNRFAKQTFEGASVEYFEINYKDNINNLNNLFDIALSLELAEKKRRSLRLTVIKDDNDEYQVDVLKSSNFNLTFDSLSYARNVLLDLKYYKSHNNLLDLTLDQRMKLSWIEENYS